MPRYIDFTVELMGDPGSSYRREPTESERARVADRGYSVERERKGGTWKNWPVGETRSVPTRRQANRVRDQSRRNYGHVMVVRMQQDGTCIVTREA